MTSKTGRIPAGWEWRSGGRHNGYYRHDGYALNQCQWRKPAIWTVVADKEKQTAAVRCNWTYYVNNDGVYSRCPATLTIVGDTLKVDKGPWKITPQPDETPLLAAIRWVRQQENAAQQLGSK